MNSLIALRVIWISSHIAVFYSILNQTELNWVYGIIFSILCHFIGQGVALHRYFSHRGFEVSVPMKYFLTASTIPCALGSPLSWSALHRHHHKHSDTEKDLISPNLKSWRSIYFSTYLGTTAGLSFIKDFANDKFQIFVHKNYIKIFIIWALLVYMLLDISGLILFVALPIVWVYNVTMIGTIIVHSFGYQNYKTDDQSKNSIIMSIITLGDGWHNNHHYNSKNYRHGIKWWEFDLLSLFIDLIKLKKLQ